MVITRGLEPRCELRNSRKPTSAVATWFPGQACTVYCVDKQSIQRLLIQNEFFRATPLIKKKKKSRRIKTKHLTEHTYFMIIICVYWQLFPLEKTVPLNVHVMQVHLSHIPFSFYLMRSFNCALMQISPSLL